MRYLSHLECSKCNIKLDSNRLWNLCPDCHKPLFARYNLDVIKEKLNKEKIKQRQNNIWRYQELLPVGDKDFMLSLGEGATPLIFAKRLGEEVGVKNIYIKDEGNNPTGSFKARGLSIAVSRAWELGVKALSIPSAGNAAGAMSAYSALAGIPSYVYMPSDVPQPFEAECKAFGANIKLIDGLITDCGRIALAEAKKYGRFDLSTLREPYRLEGKKTMGFEIAEQLNWHLPDVIIYPTGGGTGLIGMWKAFEEMEKLGWINEKRPRMVAVQAAGCAPIVQAYQEGSYYAETWPEAKTIADGLRVPAAIGDFLILDILRKSKGIALTVTDSEMLEGVKLLGKTQGLFVSPESGATIIALCKLLSEAWIKESESVVLFNTGSGYKYSHLLQKS